MSHLSEDQLVLYYYGEPADPGLETHLAGCAECRAEYRTLERILNVVDGYSASERDPEYAAQLWRRIEKKLPLPYAGRWRRLGPRQWAASAALALFLMLAFYAGRLPVDPRRAGVAEAPEVFGRGVLRGAVSAHLDRSQLILVELANEGARASQEDVHDLLEANRLYRTTAEQAGEQRLADVLDELERLLVEMQHMTPEDAEELSHRIHDEGVLFKVRVLGSQMK